MVGHLPARPICLYGSLISLAQSDSDSESIRATNATGDTTDDQTAAEATPGAGGAEPDKPPLSYVD